MTTTTHTIPLIWVAARDGIGHARRRQYSTRYLCGARAIDVRYAWPLVTRCARCAEADTCA